MRAQAATIASVTGSSVQSARGQVGGNLRLEPMPVELAGSRARQLGQVEDAFGDLVPGDAIRDEGAQLLFGGWRRARLSPRGPDAGRPGREGRRSRPAGRRGRPPARLARGGHRHRPRLGSRCCSRESAAPASRYGQLGGWLGGGHGAGCPSGSASVDFVKPPGEAAALPSLLDSAQLLGQLLLETDALAGGSCRG
jgi:hypothetical protein